MIFLLFFKICIAFGLDDKESQNSLEFLEYLKAIYVA